MIVALLSVASAALWVAGARRDGMWLCHLAHLLMVAAMVAMALPQHDPVGPVVWIVALCALGVAVAWTERLPIKSRISGSWNLAAMAAMFLAMHSAHSGPMQNVSASHAHVQGTGFASLILVIGVWLAGRLLIARMTPPHRHDESVPRFRHLFRTSAELSMAAAMGAMAVKM